MTVTDPNVIAAIAREFEDLVEWAAYRATLRRLGLLPPPSPARLPVPLPVQLDPGATTPDPRAHRPAA